MALDFAPHLGVSIQMGARVFQFEEYETLVSCIVEEDAWALLAAKAAMAPGERGDDHATRALFERWLPQFRSAVEARSERTVAITASDVAGW